MKTTHRTTHTDCLTIAEFERLPDEDARLELVAGRVVREPLAGFEHGAVATRIAARLASWAVQHDLGTVVVKTGFVLRDEPPTVRGPDVAFVAREHLPADRRRFAPTAPDLAVEIVSPSNTLAQLRDKVADYLEAGTRIVWVVHPRRKIVTVHRLQEEPLLLTAEREIDGGAILPGFRAIVAEFFPAG